MLAFPAKKPKEKLILMLISRSFHAFTTFQVNLQHSLSDSFNYGSFISLNEMRNFRVKMKFYGFCSDIQLNNFLCFIIPVDVK